MAEDKKDFEKIIKKIEELKKSGSVDLSTEEDLSIAVMNLISLEEHFFFTGKKTGKENYFNLLDEVRRIRKKLLAKLIQKTEGEVWCISKHLLATTMRLIEVGTKNYSDGKKKEAKEMFDYAYKIYSLFWALRLNLINTSELKKIEAGDPPAGEAGKPWTVEDLVNKLVDCCDE